VRIPTGGLLLRDKLSPPKPHRRKIRFNASTKNEVEENRILPPRPGTADDPRTTGGILELYNSAGSDEVVVVPLPASGWELIGRPSKPRGYRFRGWSREGPIDSVVILEDRLKVKGGGSRLKYTLDEPSQGSVALRLTIGTGITWCADAPGDPRRDRREQFGSMRNAPRVESCPPVPEP
jgi:hypothetical protein